MAIFTTRPVFMARRGVVTAEHYLAASAGYRILLRGGNAFDAAAATCLALTLLEPHNCGLGGEAPTLVYIAKERKSYAISGVGWSPEAFTIEWCRDHNIDLIPGDGFLPACVPSVLDTMCLLLSRFGTLRFVDVAGPTIELAESGYPVYPGLHDAIANLQDRFRNLYPTTAEIYLPQDMVPPIGSRLVNLDWAETLRKMCQAEAVNEVNGRVKGIQAARDVFYKGEIAKKIIDYIHMHPVIDDSGKEHAGLLSFQDMEQWEANLEAPASLMYRGHLVNKCPSWTQGPVFLQQLAILEGYNIKSMQHNSAEYLHVWLECAKLAFADREAYYGDPNFDDVPLDVLLSKDYNDTRRDLIDNRASVELRPGDVGFGIPEYATIPVIDDHKNSLRTSSQPGDTVHLDVVDADGNMVACTPSGGWFQSSPVIPGLGFPLGTRGQMFYLNPDRPNALSPHKRPRATLTPTLVTKDDNPVMAFGTQGGDAQDQWTLQFFLNVMEFGMNLQEAIDAPTIYSEHFPSSFYPRAAFPNRALAEGRIPIETINGLRDRGHDIITQDDWVHGRVLAVAFDREHGLLQGAASPRGQISYVMGW